MIEPVVEPLIEHRPPFAVDYCHDGRRFVLVLEGPSDWRDAEAHLRSLRQTAEVVGGDHNDHVTNILTLWIDGLAVWLKAKWRNWRLRP